MDNKNTIENKQHSPQKEDHPLLLDLKNLIESTKNKIIYTSNAELVILHWNIGKRIQEDILQNQRGDYGDKIVVTLSRQFSWSHFIELIPRVKT